MDTIIKTINKDKGMLIIEAGPRPSASPVFGRAREMEIILDALKRRAVAVAGGPGMGRSALASAVY